jgi:hypothetical protein
MSQRIRGQEATIQVVVDGDVKTGSFSKVSDFSLDPRTDIQETDFLGEIETDLDIQHHGYDFSFTLHEQDKKTHDLLFDIVTREQNRVRHPAVNIVVSFAYRAGEPMSTIVLENCFMKMDTLSIGGRKEYITNKFSGKCKTIAEV